MSEATADLAALAAGMKAKMEQSNPSNAPGATVAERKRIPMSLPQRKLQVPDIPGYVLYWLLGKPDRIAQATAAFYEFVTPEEVELTDTRVGADHRSASTDLGNRVSVVAGDELDGSGQPLRLYLMKVRREYYEEDLAVVQERNSQVVDALTATYQQGTVGGIASGETGEDARNRYVDPRRTTVPDFFKPKTRRA